jgi:hypothetical protein
MKFKKSVSFFLLLNLFVTTPAFATSNTLRGKTCKKIGITKVYYASTFTCVKVGKKLVWNRGVDLMATPLPKPAK